MPETSSIFQKAEALEKKWRNPPAQGDKDVQPEDWRPLPEGDYKDWAPLKDPWVMLDALREVRNNTEIVKPLSNECAEKLSNLWRGGSWPGQHPCGHAVHGAPHFHCYEIKQHSQWKPWRANPASAGSNSWWCSDFKNAAQHYSFTSYPGGTFEQLAAALQSAVRLDDETLTAAVCLKILDWGGVRQGKMKSKKTIAWLDNALTAGTPGTLIELLKEAASLLCPRSTKTLTAFFGGQHPKAPMNSGSTKIFSALAMDFSAGLGRPKLDVLIFDGRVSTGLGFIARKLSCPNPVPSEFLFPFYDSNERRDSSCPICAPFPAMSRVRNAQRAEYARIASRCIQQVLGQYHPSAGFISAEKALFMIGYDVQKTCSGSHRVCQSNTDKAPPRPRKPQQRTPAATPVPAQPHERRAETLGQGVEFSYTGAPENGTDLYFGDGRMAPVSAAEYALLRAHFRGMRVAIGASRTNPPNGSLGAWLIQNLRGRPAIASYVAPILIDAGWARRINNRTIEFL